MEYILEYYNHKLDLDRDKLNTKAYLKSMDIAEAGGLIGKRFTLSHFD